MKTTDNRLVEWAINQAQTRYKEEISILLEHNTYCLEEDRSVRYVNTIISDLEAHIGLTRTFIINGIGYDFNQVSWKSFERDAEAKGFFITVLAEANILYSKNEADKQRFLYLRAKLFANLANPQYMFERGLEWLNNAMEISKTLQFEDTLFKVRKAAGAIMDYLTVAITCYNQTYNKGFDRLADLKIMKYVPIGFIEKCGQIVMAKSTSEIKNLCFDIMKSVRDFFKTNDTRAKNTNCTPDYENLADWYQECCYYFRRIYHFCSENDFINAFRESSGIQTDLEEISKDYNILELDILTHYDANNLPDFAKKVKFVEDCIVSAIKAKNVKVDSYSSVDEFIAKNS